MKVKIQQFDRKNLEETIALFIEAYSPDDEFLAFSSKSNYEEATAWLNYALRLSSEFCFEAVDENENFLGAQFCYWDRQIAAKTLYLDTIHVKPEFRKNGIAKLLVKHAIETAKSNDFELISMVLDIEKDFPRNWFKKAGFNPVRWVEHASPIDDIRLDLL